MPVHNETIAAIFDEIADLLELSDANPFRVRAYRRAAQSVRAHARELQEELAAGRDLDALPGIGTDLAGKVAEIVRTGSCALRRELKAGVPRGQTALLKLPGLGPKRVRELNARHGITTPAQLERALARGRAVVLPAATTATGARLTAALAQRSTPVRTLRGVAAPVAAALVARLRATRGVASAVVAGSFRRGRDTVGDLDLLVSSEAPAAAIDAFLGFDEVAQVVARGRTRAAVVLASGLPVDLRVVPAASFGAALLYFTGSKAHSSHLRQLAQRAGLKLNEYGVFCGARRVAGTTEEQVYRALGLPPIPPELREDRGEIEAAQAGRVPQLVTRANLRGDLHVHTDASDGTAPLGAMVAAARAAGLAYVGIADHSKNRGVTHGLDAAALMRQGAAIDALATRGIAVLKGVEVDIREDGTLALPEAALAQLDYVIGAVHSGFTLPERRQTERLLRALDNPRLTILAHPRGRLLNERPPMAFDMDAVVAHAAQRGAFLELNCQPARLDLPDVDCELARLHGVQLAVGRDSRGPDGFALLEPGLLQARRAGCTAADILNTLPLRKLRAALAAAGGGAR